MDYAMTETGKRVEEALEWLYSTQLFGIKLGLENTEKLLGEFLAYPAVEVKVVQVAGTNGKGSTCAMMESVARAHGIKTGLFTSPHLVRFHERIKVRGEDVDDLELATLLEEVRELVQDWDPHPTFFELSLAVAMKCFKAHECELIILETGMGGRLDATTAVPADLSVITPIGMDHQQYLGETLSEIAGEKAGIMRKGKPVLSAPQEDAAEHVLRVSANKLRCPFSLISDPLQGFSLALAGEHQRRNAALALEALHTAGYPMKFDAVATGLRTVEWKGRFQRVSGTEGETVIDSCHNVPAAEELVKLWQETFREKKAHLLFSAAADKNVSGVLDVLLPICESVEVYTLLNPRAEKAEVLYALVKEKAPLLPCRVIKGLEEVKPVPLRLVTGSLFLVGEWLEHAAPPA